MVLCKYINTYPLSYFLFIFRKIYTKEKAMQKYALLFKLLVLLTVSAAISACGGGGGGSSSSQTVNVKLNISQDNFSSPSGRLSMNNTKIESLLLTVSGYETSISEDILQTVESEGFVSLELTLNKPYTFGITAEDADGAQICTGSKTVNINASTNSVSLVCESSSGSYTLEISGVAASGLPLAGGVIYLKDANGEVVQSDIDDSGNFNLPTEGLTAPFIIKAVGTVGTSAKTLYAFTDGSGGTLNLNPYVSLAAAAALGTSDMDAVYDNPSEYKEDMTYDNIYAASQSIIAIFRDILSSLGVEDADPLSGQYSADSSGIDGVLDYLELALTPSGFQVMDKTTGEPVISGTVNTLVSASPPALPANIETMIASYVSVGVSQIAETKAFIEDLIFTQSRGSFEAYMADNFSYHDGYSRESMSYTYFESGMYQSIENFQIYKRLSTTKVEVYFYTVSNLGEKFPQTYLLEKINNVWYITGNENKFFTDLKPHIVRTFSTDNTKTYKTGLEVHVYDEEHIGAAVFKVIGPGMPESGLTIYQDNTAYDSYIVNSSGDKYIYYMNTSELAEVQNAFDNKGFATYTITAYPTYTGSYVPSGTPIQTITETLYKPSAPFTNAPADLDSHFVYLSGINTHDPADLSSGQTIQISYNSEDNEILNGFGVYVCNSIEESELSSGDILSSDSNILSVTMQSANYSLMKNCTFKMGYIDPTLVTFTDEWKMVSALDQFATYTDFTNAVSETISETSVLGSNLSNIISSNLNLPSSIYGVSITWAVENMSGDASENLFPNGTISRPYPASGDVYAMLTGTIQTGNDTINIGPFDIYVKSQNAIDVNVGIGFGGLGYSADGTFQMDKYSYDPTQSEYTLDRINTYGSSMIGAYNDTNYETSGSFSIIGNYEEDASADNLYLISINGGVQADSSFDGDSTTGDVSGNNGVIYTLIPGDILVNGGDVNINLLTHTAFQFVQYLVSAQVNTDRIMDALDEYAKAKIKSDLNSDGIINYYDILAYQPYTGTSINSAMVDEVNTSPSEMSDMISLITAGNFDNHALYKFINNTSEILDSSAWTKYKTAAFGNIAVVQSDLLLLDIYNLSDIDDRNEGIVPNHTYGTGPIYLSETYLITTDDGSGDPKVIATPYSGTTLDTSSAKSLTISGQKVLDIDESNGSYYFEKGNSIDIISTFDSYDANIDITAITGARTDLRNINVSSDERFIFRSNDAIVQVLDSNNSYAVDTSAIFTTIFGFEAINSIELYENNGRYYLFFIGDGRLYYTQFTSGSGFSTLTEVEKNHADYISAYYIDGTKLYTASNEKAIISIYDISDMPSGVMLNKKISQTMSYEDSPYDTWYMTAYNGNVIVTTNGKTRYLDTAATGDLNIATHFEGDDEILSADILGNELHTASGMSGNIIYDISNTDLSTTVTVTSRGQEQVPSVTGLDDLGYTFKVDLINDIGILADIGALAFYDATDTSATPLLYNTLGVMSYVVDKDRNLLFATLLDGQLYKYDIGLTDTEQPLGFTPYSEDMTLYGSDYLYIAMTDGIEGYSVKAPTALTAIDVSSTVSISNPPSVAVIGDYLAVADNSYPALMFFPIDPTDGSLSSDPAGGYSSVGNILDLAADEETGILYCSLEDGGVAVYQFNDLGANYTLEFAGYIPTPQVVTDMKISGDNVYIYSGYGGLDVLPRLLGKITIPALSNIMQGLP